VRTDATRLAFAAALLALAGCAGRPLEPTTPPTPAATTVDCADATCGLPADVRAWLVDRDECDHFRGEPWPEGDTDADRARRRQLVDGIRTACAGVDARLDDLRSHYRDDLAVLTALARFTEPAGP